MPRKPVATAKPCIMIYIDPHPGQEAKLREVEAGIEEEGIPCAWRAGEGDAVLLAYRGAEDAQLEVGVGITADGMCVHYRKLPQDKPLFFFGKGEHTAACRLLGCNAARLVKGIPFKSFCEDGPDRAEKSADLNRWIIDIVQKVIKEKLEGHGR